MGEWLYKVPGVVEAWFGGAETGNAIADVLLGEYNPSGKLPVTFPDKWEDCSAYGLYKTKDSVTEYSDGIFVGYRYFDDKNITPLFPFGFGLSYTTFDYSDIKINKKDDGSYLITFKVKNSGSTSGTEIPQLYISQNNPSVARPPKELKAFGRIYLEPGEIKTVSLPLGKSRLAFYDPGTDNWKVEPGEYEVMIGSSSRDLKLIDKFILK